MARYINECDFILRNLSQELRSRCPTEGQYCCYLHCCFVNRQHKEIWETWYFWLGLALVGLLAVTMVTSLVVGSYSRKRHQLVRVRGRAVGAAEGGDGVGMAATCSAGPVEAPVAAVTGPDGLIQPEVVGGGLPAELAARYRSQGTALDTALLRSGSKDSSDFMEATANSRQAEADVEEDIAGPLEPAYPPMQPMTIVRGPLPRSIRAGTYTEMVLPPGYVNPQPSHKHGPN